MDAMQIFEHPEFGQVRMLEEDGKMLFCGKDIATALGYSHTVSAVKQHCHGVIKRRLEVQTGIKADGSPAIQQVEMSFIPENDVYRMITHSRLPAAKKFANWIFNDILPAQFFKPQMEQEQNNSSFGAAPSSGITTILQERGRFFMNNSVKTFEHSEFGAIRTLEIDGEPWFVGKDIATALGYSSPYSALARHVDKEDKEVAKCETPGGMQKLTIINGNGLYKLIFSSKLPNAKKIKNWIDHDVLPVLLKHNDPAKFGDILPTQFSNPQSADIAHKEPILEEKPIKNDENCSHMPELVPIEREGVRVLLTTQLAEAYETTTQIISKNFKRNECRYQFGKHFFVLEGETLKEFKITNRQFDDQFKHTPKVYLWTEKGALLHAKSLNTDKAWEVYEYLVDHYFRTREALRFRTNEFSSNQFDISDLSPELQMFKKIFDSVAQTQMEQKRQAEKQERMAQEQARQAAEQERILQEQEQQQKALETVDHKIDDIREIVVIRPETWRKECHRLINAIAQKRGNSPEAYRVTNAEVFDLVDRRAKVSLQTRLTNLRNRMAENGLPKSALRKLNKVDVIAQDDKLREIYIAIIKEMCIQYGASVDIVNKVQSI